MTAEEPSSNWFDRNNPLNNGLGSGGGSGLGSYPNLTVAAQDVANNLATGNYGYNQIDYSLEQNAPLDQFAAAVGARGKDEDKEEDEDKFDDAIGKSILLGRF